jgi:hypothetical protein
MQRTTKPHPPARVTVTSLLTDGGSGSSTSRSTSHWLRPRLHRSPATAPVPLVPPRTSFLSERWGSRDPEPSESRVAPPPSPAPPPRALLRGEGNRRGTPAEPTPGLPRRMRRRPVERRARRGQPRHVPLFPLLCFPSRLFVHSMIQCACCLVIAERGGVKFQSHFNRNSGSAGALLFQGPLPR